MKLSFVLLVSTFVAFVHGDAIDNGLTADPSVKCANDHMVVSFTFDNPFDGSVYVKGQHLAGPPCRIIGDGAQTTLDMNIDYGTCGTDPYNPVGGNTIEFVVSFHEDNKLTKVDRLVIATCTYDTATITVWQDLYVSDKVTSDEPVTDFVPPPICTMEITDDNNASVSTANVGDKLKVKTRCEPVMDEWGTNYCSYTHSCLATNPNDPLDTCVLTDEFGCTLTDVLMGSNIGSYNSDHEYWGAMGFHTWTFPEQGGFDLTCTITSFYLDNQESNNTNCPTTCAEVQAALSSRRRKRSEQRVTFYDASKKLKVNSDMIPKLDFVAYA